MEEPCYTLAMRIFPRKTFLNLSSLAIGSMLRLFLFGRGTSADLADSSKSVVRGSIKDWWNSQGNHFATPREHLFQILGIAANATGLHPVGKGFVLYLPQSPSALTYSKSGDGQVMQMLQAAARAVHLSLKETNSLVLRRGPYVIAAGLEGESPAGVTSPVTVTGALINLFDANLEESSTVAVTPGTRAFLLDVNYFKSASPRILSASAKITDEHSTANALTFRSEGIDQTQAVVRILSNKGPVKRHFG